MSSIVTNHSYLATWISASNKTVRQNPQDILAAYVHLALNELYQYQPHATAEPITKRREIFELLQKAAKKGYPRAIFFVGLALSEGFGCAKDVPTGAALIQSAAKWLKCDLAISYVHLCKGRAFLYGNGVPQSYEQAILNLKNAGDIAKPDLDLIAAHFRSQEQRFQRLQQLHGVMPSSRRPTLVCA